MTARPRKSTQPPVRSHRPAPAEPAEQLPEVDREQTGVYESADDLIGDTSIDEAGVPVDLPNGRAVLVRQLTRDEHLWIGKGTEDAAVIEARMLSVAMVRPKLTIPQAVAWQKKADTSVVALVTSRIRDLSGFGQGAAKSPVDEVRD